MSLSDAVLIADADVDAAGLALARRLLDRAVLVAGAARFTLEEVELYYWGPSREDPFAHRHPVQRVPGRWYFHRQGASYRGGSYKGLDLTFGDPTATTHGGVLLRTLRRADGALVSGPSCVVDALLEATGAPDVATLDARAAPFAARSPLRLEDAPPRGVSPLRTARVGLTLKRCRLPLDPASAMPRHLLRPDRLLTDPRGIPKGRVHIALALARRHALQDVDTLHALTGTPRPHLARWLAAYRAGREEASFAPYVGRAWGAEELARLHGLWDARFGREDAPGGAAE